MRCKMILLALLIRTQHEMKIAICVKVAFTFIAMFIFANGTATSASAQVLTRCGASAGYAWFFNGTYVPEDQSGWEEDGISGGQILLLRDGDQLDVIYTDSVGTRSARSDGGEVIYLGDGGNSRFISVLIIYLSTATTEHYLFNVDNSGEGEVLFSTMRPAGLVQKASLLRAACSSP